MYGTAQNIIDTGKVFNITSYREGLVRLSYLCPPNQLGQYINRDFDIAYMNYVLSNDIVFKQFFDIVYNLYIGEDVYLVMDNSDWSENIMESLLKLIQQRYGYNAYKIDCFDDYMQAFSSSFVSDFDNTYGIQNLDMDKDRYTYIIENERLRNGGQMI